jgi:hypothetical protein
MIPTADESIMRGRINQLEASVGRLMISNADLLEAAVAFDACLSDLCDGPERDKLRAAIAAARGEG